MQCSGIIESMSMPEEELMIDCPPISDAAPVVIGGVGGSGTRVFAQLLQDLGFDMGSDLNESLDDLGFTALFKRSSLWPICDHINDLSHALQIYLTSRGTPTPKFTSEAEQKARTRQLIASISSDAPWLESGSIEQRLKGLCEISPISSLWGWKEPNTHIFLPFLLQAMPNLTYIQIVRDGRDMAHSANKNQLALWGNLFMPGQCVDKACPQDAFNYWCAAHQRVIKIAQVHPRRVCLITLESFVLEPEKTLDLLLDSLKHLPITRTVSDLQYRVEAPKSTSRHLNYEPLVATEAQRKLLRSFGYSW
jgi:hypothetical protein